MTSLQLSVPSSPLWTSRRVFGIGTPPPDPIMMMGLVPIELKNGCSEEDCSIDSDDPVLTNALRRHFLEHFGHRDLDGMVADYAEDAVLVHVVNGVRKSYHGHEQIREALVHTFEQHPSVNSTFRLEQIVIRDRVGSVHWSATTPKNDYPEGNQHDTFRFDVHGKISKQFFNGEVSPLETPWYVDGN